MKYVFIILSAILLMTLTVTCKKDVQVTSVALNKTSLTLEIGKIETLIAMVLPDNATNKEVSWLSDNLAVASVTNNGLVTAHSIGTATITVTTLDGNKTASCTVEVCENVEPPVAVIGVTLDKVSLTLEVEETETLIATVLPNDATNKEVSWTSSNPAVATVTNGLITALSVGITSITVTTLDGNKTAICNVEVYTSFVEG